MSDSVRRLFYKIGEVCEQTGTQPYVLRFWESEFPMLRPRKNRAGQRVYQPADIELIERIKHLLYEEEYTIAGARKQLEQERRTGKKKSKKKTAKAAPPAAPPAEPPAEKVAPADPPRTDLEEQVQRLREERAAHAREAHMARTEADDLRRRLEALEQQVGDGGGAPRAALSSLRKQAADLQSELDALLGALRSELQGPDS